MLEVLLHGTVHNLSAGTVCRVYLHFDHIEICDLIFPIVTSEESQEVVKGAARIGALHSRLEPSVEELLFGVKLSTV